MRCRYCDTSHPYSQECPHRSMFIGICSTPRCGRPGYRVTDTDTKLCCVRCVRGNLGEDVDDSSDEDEADEEDSLDEEAEEDDLDDLYWEDGNERDVDDYDDQSGEGCE